MRIGRLRKIWEKNFHYEKDALPASVELSPPRYFSLAEIKLATQNFSEALVIGRGGFGKVYKGCIGGIPEIVAIKRLDSCSKQGAPEFWTEIETLSKLRHIHLVSLIGYCNESQEMILVYDYIPGGTLADNLYKFTRKGRDCAPLSWDQRLRICIGVARGLDYLHTGSEYGVIHRDMKDTNILLDGNLVAKITDFGLSKLEKVTQFKSYVSTKVRGTFGYFDPDYFLTGRLTRKSDVYAFGMVMLVVLSGRPAVDRRNPEEPQSLLTCFQECMAEDDLTKIVDPILWGAISLNRLREFVKIVDDCLRLVPEERPTMVRVVASLEQALEQHRSPLKSAAEEGILVGNSCEANGTVLSFQLNQQKAPIHEESVIFPPKEEITSTAIKNLGSPTRGRDSESRAEALRNKTLEQHRSPLKSAAEEGILVANSCEVNETSLSFQLNQQEAPIHEESLISSTTEEITSTGIENLGSPTGGQDSESRGEDYALFQGYPLNVRSNKSTSNISYLVPLQYYLREIRASTNNCTLSTSNISYKVPLQCYLREIRACTNNFTLSNRIGGDRSGPVYRGTLPNGKQIAVKRLSRSLEAEAFKFVILMVIRSQHRNLVRLLGYCWESGENILIYEFVPNKSLDYFLFDPKKRALLGWSTRCEIIRGIARVLLYLHEDSCSMHLNLSASNVLLDRNMNPKIANSGLGRLVEFDETQELTLGYMAPEYLRHGQFSYESDVFSFGVLVLEIISGRKNSHFSGSHYGINLLTCAWRQWRDGTSLALVDPSLGDSNVRDEVIQCIQIGLLCVQDDAKERPTMASVVEMLKSYSVTWPTDPNPPAFYGLE